MDIDIQLSPFAETGSPPITHLMVERKLKQGVTLKIGRQVFKDGQIQSKMNDHGLDIWFISKVVSRHHAEIWPKDGQLYIRDVGSSSGTFLNKMRLSPSAKGSRPYPLKDGDILQFGVDYKGKTEDIFKSIVLRVAFLDQRRNQANPIKFQTALKSLLLATNPYASSTTAVTDDKSPGTECCICINTIGPYQALFISPCSHCFHFKCVSSILSQSQMFPCPMCRQVANLIASVSMESIVDEEEKKMSESDSDVSVTVDESGSAIQNQIHVSHAHSISPTAVSLIAQAQVQAQVQPVKPLPSVPSCTQKVLVKPSITLVDSTRPTNLLASRPVSVDDTKHKSFASKLSAFLQRKPSHYHSNSGSSSTSTTQPAAIPDQVVIVIEENDDTPIEAYLTPLGPDDENQLLMDHEMTVDQCLVIRPETNNVLNTMKTSKSSLADFMEISNVINNVVAENKTEHGTQL